MTDSKDQEIFEINRNLIKKSFLTKNKQNQWKTEWGNNKFIKIKVQFQEIQ